MPMRFVVEFEAGDSVGMPTLGARRAFAARMLRRLVDELERDAPEVAMMGELHDPGSPDRRVIGEWKFAHDRRDPA
jgi:hypothetical protein